MIKVKVDNCNNISSANITILKNRLNIRFAMNGTGKSTIAKAIELNSKDENLSPLKTFGNKTEPQVVLSEPHIKVLVFNEDFVNTIVFKESEVIQNAYEVFIKTPAYEARQKSITERLKNIHVDVSQNDDLQKIISASKRVLPNFSLTNKDELKQVGLIKSLTNSENIFNLPAEIIKFKPLMEKEYNVDWVGWKNDGSKYDDNNICPFCTSSLDANYESEKALFSSSYTKSNVRNIKEMLSYFDEVNEYMDEEKSKILYRCIKDTKDIQAINLWVKRFYLDLKYLADKINKIIEFNTFQVGSEDISHLDEQLQSLKINISDLVIFNNKKIEVLIAFIDNQIDSVLGEIDVLKNDFGRLRGLINDTKKNAIIDINEFLYTAGINYKIEIKQESDTVTKTYLQYISKSDNPVEVNDIRMHLSWGERNAFALVLFMHYALSQNPELVILDDPISSFDSNKKYAIINRLFIKSSKRNSFYKKTVLMLTHDFQPVIDFVINNRPNHRKSVSAFFLQNKAGLISEQEITEDDIKSLPVILAENSKNDLLNKIHRVASLRKFLEYMPKDPTQDLAYNLLSCLLHGKKKPTHKDDTEITKEEIKSGEDFIRNYIVDFEYLNYCTKIFTQDYLLKLFNEEKNSYFRLQVFRVLITILDLRPKIKNDPLLKYIDEQFHIENDYIFYLDFMKYDIVPDFVIPKCVEYLQTVKIE